MSSFTKPLTVTKREDGLWEIARQFTYFVGEEDSNIFVEVPKGFKTDFASVPRPFWFLFPPDGKYSQAAVVHDFLYNTQEYSLKYDDQVFHKEITRKAVDKIFLEAMSVLGVNWFVRHTMYWAVRLGGGVPWNKRAKELEDDQDS